MSWYYEGDGKRQGPVSQEELDRLHDAGTVTESTLVWTSGMGDWQPYREATGGAGAPPPPPAIEPGALPADSMAGEPAAETAAVTVNTCSQCGNSFSPVELITLAGQQVCANCKPVFLQRLKEGAIVPGQLAYAGFWIRAGARLIDGIILYAVGMLISLPAMFLMGSIEPDPQDPLGPAFVVASCLLPILQLGIAVAYETWFLGRYGATPGKMLCRLRVVLSDGTPISYARGAGRHFATFLSGMILFIGYLMAAWDEEKRALHDHICNTRVVRIG